MAIQEIESNHEGGRRDADNNDFPQMSGSAREARFSVSLGSRIALVHPVCAEIVSDVEHLDVRESHRAQRVVGRLDVGAMAPRATAAINNDELVPGQRLDALAQRLQAAFAGGRPDVFGTGNMRLRVKTCDPTWMMSGFSPAEDWRTLTSSSGLRSWELGMELA